MIQSSPSSTASTSVINPASAPSIDTPEAALATTPITDIGLSTSKPTTVGGEQRNQDKGNVNVVMSVLSHTGPTASISAINPASAPSHNAPGAVLTTPSITDFGLASKSTVVGGEQLDQDKGNDDIIMSDALSFVQKPQDDVNLSPWLVPMIKYLRGVATDTAWQNLVTEFIEFEKGDPPTGVSFFFFKNS